jgi:hypothetical protein
LAKEEQRRRYRLCLIPARFVYRRTVMKKLQNRLERAGAAGKAMIVWLATGSLGAALVAYLLFSGMGC